MSENSGLLETSADINEFKYHRQKHTHKRVETENPIMIIIASQALTLMNQLLFFSSNCFELIVCIATSIPISSSGSGYSKSYYEKYEYDSVHLEKGNFVSSKDTGSYGVMFVFGFPNQDEENLETLVICKKIN